MKAPAFGYVRPQTVEEALEALARYGDDANILAGGQSLLPALNMRLIAPAILVDINRLKPLAEIRGTGPSVVVGALTRHSAVAASTLVNEALPLIASAMPHVAHEAVRNRGTFGGSIALGDPAAEMPACAVALGAEIVLRSVRGTRRVRAEDFFTGLYSTARDPDELLVEVEFPKRPSLRVGFGELARRHGDFALAGLAAVADMDDNVIRELRLVYFGTETHPRLAATAGVAVKGQRLNESSITAILEALDTDLDPMTSLHGRSDTKRHLAKVLTRRVLTAMCSPMGRPT